jgi:hypothetical protein
LPVARNLQCPLREAVMENPSVVAESLRKEHRRVRKELKDAGIMAGVLPKEMPSRRRKGMQMIGAILDDCVRAHAEWEARVLAPVVGKPPDVAKEALAGSVGELVDEAGAPLPDVRAFGTLLQGVIGALNAHLEQEQRLLQRLGH